MCNKENARGGRNKAVQKEINSRMSCVTALFFFIYIVNRVLFITLKSNEKLFAIVTDQSVFLPSHLLSPFLFL